MNKISFVTYCEDIIGASVLPNWFLTLANDTFSFPRSRSYLHYALFSSLRRTRRCWKSKRIQSLFQDETMIVCIWYNTDSSFGTWIVSSPPGRRQRMPWSLIHLLLIYTLGGEIILSSLLESLIKELLEQWVSFLASSLSFYIFLKNVFLSSGDACYKRHFERTLTWANNHIAMKGQGKLFQYCLIAPSQTNYDCLKHARQTLILKGLPWSPIQVYECTAHTPRLSGEEKV